METRVKLQSEALERSVVFTDRPDLVLTPKETALVANISAALAAVRTYGTTQVSGLQDLNNGVSNRRFLASDIRGRLRDIAEIAKSMEEEGQVGMVDLFRYPKYSTYESLLLTAAAFADRAAPITAQFTDRGLPATFEADLRVKITAFRVATDNKNLGRADRTAGTAGLFFAAREGMKALRALRPILRVHLKSEPALLEAWNLASRVERVPRGTPQAPATQTPPPPVEVPSSGT